MSAEDWVNIIKAVGAAAAVVIAALMPYLLRRIHTVDAKVVTVDAKVDTVDAKVDTVQETVNGNHKESANRISQLTAALTDKGMAVPAAPILPIAPAPYDSGKDRP